MLTASADTNGEPGSAPVWVNACPLAGGCIDGLVFPTPLRQRCQFSNQDTAGNVRWPVDVREGFCQVTVMQLPVVDEYQRIGRVRPCPGSGFAVRGRR